MRLLSLSLLAAALFWVGSAHAQEPQTPREYDQLVEQAVADFAAGRWPEARALFLRAHAVFPNARTLRGIGMASFETGDYPETVRTLQSALASTVRPLTEEQRTQVGALLERALAYVGRVTVPATTSTARAYVDGELTHVEGNWPTEAGTLLLAVGSHRVTVRDDQNRAAEARVVIRGSENAALEIDLSTLTATTPAPNVLAGAAIATSPTRGPWPWVVTSIGAGVAVIGAVLTTVGAIEVRDVETAPPMTEWAELQPENDRAPILTGVGIACIGAGLATAAIGLTWGLSPRSNEADTSIAIGVGPGSVNVRGQW